MSQSGTVSSMPLNTDRLLTTPEAAQILGRSTRTVHRMVIAGELVPVKRLSIGPNGALLFDLRDVQRIAKDRGLTESGSAA